MLKIRKLESGYGLMEVLWGVDIDVEDNQIVALIGPNGSGKSTILKSIYRLCDVYSGDIQFDGQSINTVRREEIINMGISYAPQGKYVFDDMTVRENIEMGGFSVKDAIDFNEGLKDIYVDFPILKKKENKIANTLSGGEKQVLSIARALITNPKLLILDEPTLGLSPIVGKQIFKKLLHIKKERHISILNVEQNAKQAVEIADKTYIIEDGKVALRGGKEILKNPAVQKIYFGGA